MDNPIIKFENGFFIIENKDFQSLKSKNFGYKEKSFYFLDEYEALFLLEKGKIEVLSKNIKQKFENLCKKTKIDLKKFLVYKDLRTKGYVIKSGAKYGFIFRVYDKGIKEGQDHSLWLVEVVRESQKISFQEILGKNRNCHSTNKKLIFAIINQEGSITYIENNWKRV